MPLNSRKMTHSLILEVVIKIDFYCLVLSENLAVVLLDIGEALVKHGQPELAMLNHVECFHKIMFLG